MASPTPAAPAEAAPTIPKDFDPCAGPLELLNKIGNGTACVFVRGEAAVTGQYSSASIPISAELSATGTTLDVSGDVHAFGIPSPVVYIGVAPRAQVVITPPSFVQASTSRLGVLAAGTSNMSFEYKQLMFVDPAKFTMAALDLAYQAPTGSQAFRGPGPTYTIDPIVTQPLPHNFGLTLAFPVNNFTVSCLTCTTKQRGWSLSPQIVPYWESHGGTLLGLFVQHNFNPNTTPIAFSVGQLFGRHFELAASEGGFVRTATATGPFLGVVNATVTAYPSLFNVSANYLIGESDLPAALQQ
ncbi:MAG: hypothetical protein WCC84_09255 [Candidatus Cybelea sp.]